MAFTSAARNGKCSKALQRVRFELIANFSVIQTWRDSLGELFMFSMGIHSGVSSESDSIQEVTVAS